MKKIPITYPQQMNPENGSNDYYDTEIKSYVGISEFGEIIENSNNLDKNKNKPILATELFSKLRSIGWGKLDGRFTKDGYLWYRRYGQEGYDSSPDMPEYAVDTLPSGEYSDIGFIMSSEQGNDNGVLSSLNSVYTSIFGEVDDSITSQIIYTKTIRDKNINRINIILPGSDSYTNLVSIKDLIKYTTIPGISATVEISLKYSKREDFSIFSQALRFVAFRYDNESNLQQEDLIFDIEGDLDLSYSEGIIEVLPQSDEIVEYIIDSCTIIYGKY